MGDMVTASSGIHGALMLIAHCDEAFFQFTACCLFQAHLFHCYSCDFLQLRHLLVKTLWESHQHLEAQAGAKVMQSQFWHQLHKPKLTHHTPVRLLAWCKPRPSAFRLDIQTQFGDSCIALQAYKALAWSQNPVVLKQSPNCHYFHTVKALCHFDNRLVNCCIESTMAPASA